MAPEGPDAGHTTGHEDEFRHLFAQEAEQRIAELTRLLLALDTAPEGEVGDLVAAIFREAHTLKGAAAVVGFDEVRTVAHALESLLEQLRSGGREATPVLVDALLASVDGLRDLVRGVLAGLDRGAEAAALAAALEALAVADPGPSAATAAPAPNVAHASPPSGAPPTGAPPLGPPPAEAPPPDAPPEPTTDAAPPYGSPGPLPEPTTPDAAAVASRSVPGIEETVRVPLARLDELVRLVGESATASLRLGRVVGDRLGVDPGSLDEVRELSRVLNELQERAMRARMVPVATLSDALHRAVREVARSTARQVRWEVRGDDTELDRGVLQQLADPLLHIVRNAVDHGIEAPDDRVAAGKPAEATVRLHAMQIGSEVIVAVSDDGRGIDVDAVRAQARRGGSEVAGLDDDEALQLVFRSGLSTSTFVSDISGRGVGLDVVRTNVEAVRGRIEVRSTRGAGTEFRIVVPITLAVLPCLLVRAGGRTHALPMHSVVLVDDGTSTGSLEGRAVVWVGDQALPLGDLGATLGLEPSDDGPVVVVAGPTRRHAFRVAGLAGQRDVVVKGLSRLLPRLDLLAGASIEPDGSILLVLDVPGLIDRARAERAHPTTVVRHGQPEARPPRAARLLVVDDALTVRELQRSILERAGYEVVTAVDGVEALARLAETPADLVLTDVEMPRLDGFGLTEAIRAHPTLGQVPVLILTSRASEEDRQRGLAVGADGYIIKSAFDETGLLAAVARLLGS